MDQMVTCLHGAKFAANMYYLDNFLDKSGKKAGVVFCVGTKDTGTMGYSQPVLEVNLA